MSKHGMSILAALALLVPVAVGSPWASPDTGAARDLMAVTVSSDAQGNPVVTLSGDGAMRYETLVLESPRRLVLDLPGVVSRVKSREIPVGVGGVERVRLSQYRTDPEPISRVVVDLEGNVPYRIDEKGSDLVVAFSGEPQAEAAPSGTAAAAPPAQAEPVVAVSATPEGVAEAPKRAVPPESLEVLLRAAPVYESAEPEETPAPVDEVAAESAAPVPARVASIAPSFETRTIATDARSYTGKKLSLNLVDADVKQVFRLFHEISGLNFVLDPSVDGRVTIVLDNTPWDQALEIILKNNGLDKVMEDNVIRIASTQKLASEAAARKQLKEAKELEVEPTTITRTLSYAKAKDVERVIREGGVLSPRGKVIVDERTNTLIISDIPKKVEPIDVLISTLDSETPQVMIEARVVETTRDFTQDFGVTWGFSAIADASRGTSTSLLFPHNASVKYGLNLPGNNVASNLAFKFGNVIDSFTLDVALNTLETERKGRILSSPKIATQNNERAEIEQGIRIPVVNTTATEINVEFVSASLRLSVTPQITAEGTIILDVEVENNSPDFSVRVGDVPPIKTQRAQTKVLINDGGTTVIGGIFTVNEGAEEVGVPWFKKIPVLGWLFKTRYITDQNRELLIFITPKILKVG